MESPRNKDTSNLNMDENKSADEENNDLEEEYVTYLEEDKLDETESPIDKRKLLRSGVWEHFDVIDEDNRIATCKLCNEDLSYRTTSGNLKRHLKRKHYIEYERSDDEDNVLGEETTNLKTMDYRPKKISLAWEFFEMKDPVKRVASCKFCGKKISYFSSVSNLLKHVRRIHGIEDMRAKSDDESGTEMEKTTSSRPKKISLAWEFFEIKDPVKRVASCKLCSREISYYSTVSNLLKHVKRIHFNVLFQHGQRVKSSGDESDTEIEKTSGAAGAKVSDDSDIELHKLENNPNWHSSVWQYFRCVDKENKISACLICKKRLSYFSSLTNLKRHLYRKHPNLKLTSSDGIKKRVLISTDGQLYEIEESKQDEANDDGNEDPNDDTPALEIDSVFIEDYEGNVPTKNSKRIIKPETIMRTRKRPRRASIVYDSDSSNEITFQKRYVKKKNDSLDQFGKYLISLLKQLPKELSNQFQVDFVKQIIEAQLTYDTQKKVSHSGTSNGYAITITEQEEQVPDKVQFVNADGKIVISGSKV